MLFRTRKRIICGLAVLTVLTVSAAGLSCAKAEPVKDGPHPAVQLSAWTAYWDDEAGREDYQKIRRRLDGISAFAAYYGPDDALLVPEETKQALKQAKKDGKEAYLTVVNDCQDASGKSQEKDTALVGRLLKDETSTDAQVQLLVQKAKEAGADGIELDYERIFKDSKLKTPFLDFTYKLSSACIKENLKLRIVLEPSAPFDAPFAKGPEYVVMLYNLYGLHSGPGPKADGAFIKKTIQRMEKLPGKKSVAIATGGCLWQDYKLLGLSRGPTKFISEQEAAALAQKHKAEVKRDEMSGALTFAYDEDKHHYEVWYADDETLNAWITEIANLGITDVSIWRLGGNENLGKVHP
ncbi:hypothetical protein [Mitsuokella sp.]|uniref:hypothetical protein n=1 Tax=Mitsuokella sp. TaxID=2049034 RepID=UPI003D7C4D3F